MKHHFLKHLLWLKVLVRPKISFISHPGTFRERQERPWPGENPLATLAGEQKHHKGIVPFDSYKRSFNFVVASAWSLWLLAQNFPALHFVFFLILHFQNWEEFPVCSPGVCVFFSSNSLNNGCIKRRKKWARRIRIGIFEIPPCPLPEHHVRQQFNLEQDWQTTFKPLRIVNSRQRRSTRWDFGNPIFNICARMPWQLLEVWRTFN